MLLLLLLLLPLLFLILNVGASQDAHNNHVQLWVKTSGQHTNQIQFKRIYNNHAVQCLAKESEDIDVCLRGNDIDIKAVTKAQTEPCQCSIEYSLGCDVAIFVQIGKRFEGLSTLDIAQHQFVKIIDRFPYCDWWTVDSKACHLICYNENEKANTVETYCLKTGQFLFKIFEASSEVYIPHYDRTTKHLYYFVKEGTWMLMVVNTHTLKQSVIAKNVDFYDEQSLITGEEESRMIVWCSDDADENKGFSYIVYNRSEEVKPRLITKLFNKSVYGLAVVNGSVFLQGYEAILSVPNLSTGSTQILKECGIEEYDFQEFGSYGKFLYMACADENGDGYFYVVGVHGITVLSMPAHFNWKGTAHVG